MYKHSHHGLSFPCDIFRGQALLLQWRLKIRTFEKHCVCSDAIYCTRFLQSQVFRNSWIEGADVVVKVESDYRKEEKKDDGS